MPVRVITVAAGLLGLPLPLVCPSQVRMCVVADDCALPRDKGITGRRGVAGTVLVAKVAGAAAEAGLSLDEVWLVLLSLLTLQLCLVFCI